jgi:hypothetical protein
VSKKQSAIRLTRSAGSEDQSANAMVVGGIARTRGLKEECLTPDVNPLFMKIAGR